MERRGAKPKYDSPKTLRAAVDAYFEACAGTKTFPDYAGMLIALKITDSTAAKYQKDGENAAAYRAVFEYAKARRESWLVRRMVEEPKVAAGCMNALKQKKNGGYTDRPVDSGEKTLNININGVSGGWSSFK